MTCNTLLWVWEYACVPASKQLSKQAQPKAARQCLVYMGGIEMFRWQKAKSFNFRATPMGLDHIKAPGEKVPAESANQ